MPNSPRRTDLLTLAHGRGASIWLWDGFGWDRLPLSRQDSIPDDAVPTLPGSGGDAFSVQPHGYPLNRARAGRLTRVRPRRRDYALGEVAGHVELAGGGERFGYGETTRASILSMRRR